MGSDALLQVIGLREHLISIHAPAWGATQRMAEQYGISMISIHAPAWGATNVFYCEYEYPG